MNTKISQTDFAYMAGYIDGDGCFYIGKHKPKKRLKPKYIISIIISSVNTEVLYWFKSCFGGCVSLVTKEGANSKAQYQYSIKKQNTINLAGNILPYLIEKKEECSTAIQFCSSNDIENIDTCINRMKILKDVSNLVSKYHKQQFEKFRGSINPTTEDFAYLAGFIDAECSFNIQKYKPKNKPNFVYKIILQCNNTKAPIFRWLLQRFSGQIHFIDRRNHGKASRNQLTWRLSGKALSKIIDKIHPFLKHKKPVCGELIKFYATTLTNGGARHTQEFRSGYADVIKIREDIITNVHKLNLKGIKSNLSG